MAEPLEEKEALTAAVAELTEDDDIVRWWNGLVNMWAPACMSQSSLANEGFFFDWIPCQEGAEKLTALPPCVRPAIGNAICWS